MSGLPRHLVRRGMRSDGTFAKADDDEQAVVVNIKSGAAYDLYIGRGSIWGNPFIIGRDGTRSEVIAKYEARIRDKPALLALIRSQIPGRRLGCYCAPKACHGDVLLKLAKELSK